MKEEIVIEEGLKISELIRKLEILKEDYGDVRCVFIPMEGDAEIIEHVGIDSYKTDKGIETVAEFL